MRIAFLIVCLFIIASPSSAQNLDVTFRYAQNPGESFVRVFTPGQFNGWGPNASGRIATDAPSLMAYNPVIDQYTYTIGLPIGTSQQYKFHFQFNSSGSDWQWISDPWNPITVGPDQNSQVAITDPMVFQLIRELNPSQMIDAVSAGIFGTANIASLEFEINGVPRDGLPFFDQTTGIFKYTLPTPVRDGSHFRITAIDALQRDVSAEVGSIQSQASWGVGSFSTVRDQVTVDAFFTRADGTVDPNLTSATLIINDVESGEVAVTNGRAQPTIPLAIGENPVQMRATIDGVDVFTELLTITRRLSPLQDYFADAAVSGTSNNFTIDLTATPVAGAGFTSAWTFDEVNSTAGAAGLTFSDMQAQGTADGPGELYFDIDMETSGGDTDYRRVAVIVEADGTAREMRYAENPAWVKNAVVYEIFPLSFGPSANGTPASPGDRFNEIADELPYIADMGFNVIWFMPIFHNLVMDELSGGYNIVDFYNVDPRLGTNEDFRALVTRAHELGVKIILDWTPNHISNQHPWVNSLRDGGPFADYIQTTPSNHDRGLDGRGPNLSEIWHREGGADLYRKYDGFGDLANLDWDNDDLQAEMLDVVTFWVEEMGIDGWRHDVYWGPWRRYGPVRFGVPIRQIMKRLKPDGWELGEIAGTGLSTEVYYADDDFGSAVVGGIDAGYDWSLYHGAIRGTYGSVSNYDNFAHNNDFFPGPNARPFRFLENHDETRIAELLQSDPDRILPLTGFLLTTTGVPMVYHGQEVGFGAGLAWGGRNPVTWQTPRNGEFQETYHRLAWARRQFPAFGTQRLNTIATGPVYAFARPQLDENAVVLINFGDQSATITVDPSPHIDISHDGPIAYYDIDADTSGAYLGGFTVTVPPYETVIYITSDDPGFAPRPLPALPYGATRVATEDEDVPSSFSLEQNYPNPFNPTTTIAYTLARPSGVRLSVIDVLGREVVVLAQGEQGPGSHEVTFDATGLPTGVYLYRLQAGTYSETKAMVLVR